MHRSRASWLLVPAAAMLSGCLLLSEPPLLEDSDDALAPLDGWIDVAARGASVCALQTGGALWCGAQPLALALNDEGPFVAISQGDGGSVCGVYEDGRLFCSDSSAGNFTLDGPFLNVTGGGDAGCGLDRNGGAQCWPESEEAAGPFTTLGAGDRFACGVRQSSGGLRCWSIDDLTFDEALTQVPSGTFRQVATADHVGCAVSTVGAVSCWGYDFHELSSGPRAGDYVQLSLRYDVGCAVTPTGTVRCWGEDAVVLESQIPQDGIEYALIDLAPYDGGCGIDRTAQLHCW